MANSGITAKQKAAIRALLAGASYPEAAAAAKVHENTIGQWMKNPLFLAALHQAESEAMQAVSRELVNLAGKATGTLEGVLDDTEARDSSKIRAADVVLGRLLQIKELAELEERIIKLEEAQNVK
jgi:hypothetical protein